MQNVLHYTYTIQFSCQLSRLRVENFDLMPAHACGPISHAWLKNVTYCRLAWHNFRKYVNSDPCKERKPCVKWIKDNTSIAISDFWNENHWERASVYTRPKAGAGKCEGCFRLHHRRTSSEDFRLLRKTSVCFGNIRKWSCRFKNSQHSRDKNLTPIFQKKLAVILHWYGMYVHLCNAKIVEMLCCLLWFYL